MTTDMNNLSLFGKTLSERIEEITKTIPDSVMLHGSDEKMYGQYTAIRMALFDADYIGATLFDLRIGDESAYVLTSWASGKMLAYYAKDCFTPSSVIVSAAKQFGIWIDSGEALVDYETAIRSDA